MKYPQLVSPRAVNAISDWLVSRLEQLGVESPQIYTRLLLSLLQSSVQVNDPIEFSNLEAFFANRKGGHKRFHLPSDTETLKKLNAVQCLREIVSNEQETATIELLVEELCEKLKDIEKQTQNLSDEERFLIETHLNTDSLLQNQTNTSHLQYQQHPASSNNNNNNTTHHHRHHQPHYHHHNHHNNQQHQQQVPHICNKSNNPAFNTDSKRHHVQSTSSTTCDSLSDLDNDPKKRYFRAFPALSKEMEDSFRIWRRNAKSLTWPIVGRSIVIDNLNNSSASLSSSSASSIVSSSNFAANSLTTDKSVEKKLKGAVAVGGHQLQANKVLADIGGRDVKQYQETTTIGAAGAVAAVTTTAKKKSKRRRNQALCKGKAIQNLRKLSVGPTSNSIGGNKYHQYTHHRNSSPAWDTDFKGCWEMGPDLIKEFLSRQNGKKRNHSSSDSMDHEELSEHVIITNEIPAKNDEQKPLMKSYIDLSFCYDDDDDDDDDDYGEDGPDDGDMQQQPQSIEEGIDYVDEDYDDSTLASVSELTLDSFNPKRRLYQREGHSQKALTFGGSGLIGNTLEDSNDSIDPLDFQQFKAKFNSSVEALWKDAAPTPNINKQQQQQQSSVAMQAVEIPLNVNNQLSGGISTAFYANAMAPFKKDLWNFWSNYQHQQRSDHSNNKLSATASTSSMITTMIDDSSASSAAGADIGNSSDYFSMPSNLNDFDKSVGGVRRRNDAGASLGAHTPSINVFLQNSIWSTSGDCVDAVGGATSATDAAADESFLFKVWHSNKKLSELDVGNAVNGEKMPTIVDDNDGVNNNDLNKSKESAATIMVNNSNLGANLQFPPYQNLKWSEGINAGPPYGIHLRANNEMQSLTSSSSLRADNNYASCFSAVASISGATWEAPAYGQNTQPDLKSWCASNPISLTEMYGNDVCDSIVNNQPATEEDEEEVVNQSENALGPAVTLSNHCANTSGFVAYSRIKQCGIVQPQVKSLQTSSAARLSKDFFRSSVEEENLLTSERTHFHPIEHFVDGHTFDITNSFDAVEFERTASGLMRYESEEFLEYTRSDIYMADEEVSTSSTSLVKYGRKANEDNDKEDKFIIKFRVRRCGEISCQTEEQDFRLAATRVADLVPTSSPALGSMFNNNFALRRQENNEAIMAAVTKAVAAAAKAAAENHLNAGHFCWQPAKDTSAGETTSVTSNTKENNPVWRPDNTICDEVDFCKMDSGVIDQQQQLVQSWSMQEVEKQCHQRHGMPQQGSNIIRKFPTKADIERSEENSLDNSSLHTLWGMCAVCSTCGEYDKSMPADRLLRDELQVEADEIMSDLRYMQDLYIGESDILNEPNEIQTTGENEQLAADDKMFDYFNREDGGMDSNSRKIPINPWNVRDIKENEAQRQQQQQQQHGLVKVSMLQKVNQLIEDLLKTENARTHAKEAQENDKIIIKQAPPQLQGNSVWNFQTGHQDKTKNFWQFSEQNDNNNMWQHKPLIEQFAEEPNKNNETFEKPMKLLKQVESKEGEREEEEASRGGSTQYGEILNWKHDNLAKIWQQSMPTSHQIEEALIKHQQRAELTTNHNIKEDKFKAQPGEEENDCQNLVEEKNLKNLQNSYEPLTPPPPPPSLSTVQGNSYKIVEQFLNNSTDKMKSVANRKRRHSASQNFYQQQHLQFNDTASATGTGSSNNNNDTVSDLNAYKPGLNNTKVDRAKEASPYDNNSLLSGSNLNAEEQPAKQTIITCKYWTAATNGTQSSLDSAAAAMMLLAAATNANNANNMLTAAAGGNFDHQEDLMLDENMFGNTFSCLIDKNASILKHVTMMTRPLTR